jgi:hypothetical protein
MHVRILTAAGVLLLATWRTSPAQSGGGYDLSWSSLDCGSVETSTGGGFSLDATIGQFEDGAMAGGGYSIQGGSQPPTDAPLPPDLTEGNGPLVFRLHGNSPNPFRDRTAVGFSLARTEHVRLRIYDLAGRVVRTMLDQTFEPGHHQVGWDGRDDAGNHVAQGIYLMHLRAGNFEARRKLAIVR